MSREVEFRDLGVLSYKECWQLQQRLFDELIAAKTNKGELSGGEKASCNAGYILIVEHPAVYTLGKSGKQSNILLSEAEIEARGAEYFHIDRGGDVTFHGLGQIVCYPILDLEQIGISLKGYIEALEQAAIDTAHHFGVDSGRIEGASGVWVTDGAACRKLCAIGVKSSRYVTMHGLALNVNTDLNYFGGINPCGFTSRGVTSLEVECNKKVSMEEAKEQLLQNLIKILNVKIYKK